VLEASSESATATFAGAVDLAGWTCDCGPTPQLSLTDLLSLSRNGRPPLSPDVLGAKQALRNSRGTRPHTISAVQITLSV
jgi:hypothetical protein